MLKRGDFKYHSGASTHRQSTAFLSKQDSGPRKSIAYFLEKLAKRKKPQSVAGLWEPSEHESIPAEIAIQEFERIRSGKFSVDEVLGLLADLKKVLEFKNAEDYMPNKTLVSHNVLNKKPPQLPTLLVNNNEMSVPDDGSHNELNYMQRLTTKILAGLWDVVVNEGEYIKFLFNNQEIWEKHFKRSYSFEKNKGPQTISIFFEAFLDLFSRKKDLNVLMTISSNSKSPFGIYAMILDLVRILVRYSKNTVVLLEISQFLVSSFSFFPSPCYEMLLRTFSDSISLKSEALFCESIGLEESRFKEVAKEGSLLKRQAMQYLSHFNDKINGSLFKVILRYLSPEVPALPLQLDLIYRDEIIGRIVNSRLDFLTDILQSISNGDENEKIRATWMLWYLYHSSIGHLQLLDVKDVFRPTLLDSNDFIKAKAAKFSLGPSFKSISSAQITSHVYFPFLFPRRENNLELLNKMKNFLGRNSSICYVPDLEVCKCVYCYQVIDGCGLRCLGCVNESIHFECYREQQNAISKEKISSLKKSTVDFDSVVSYSIVEVSYVSNKQGHRFDLINIFSLTLCALCNEPIWGIFLNGLRCGICGIFTHQNCMTNHHTSVSNCLRPEDDLFNDDESDRIITLQKFNSSFKSFFSHFQLHSSIIPESQLLGSSVLTEKRVNYGKDKHTDSGKDNNTGECTLEDWIVVLEFLLVQESLINNGLKVESTKIEDSTILQEQLLTNARASDFLSELNENIVGISKMISEKVENSFVSLQKKFHSTFEKEVIKTLAEMAPLYFRIIFNEDLMKCINVLVKLNIYDIDEFCNKWSWTNPDVHDSSTYSQKGSSIKISGKNDSISKYDENFPTAHELTNNSKISHMAIKEVVDIIPALQDHDALKGSSAYLDNFKPIYLGLTYCNKKESFIRWLKQYLNIYKQRNISMILQQLMNYGFITRVDHRRKVDDTLRQDDAYSNPGIEVLNNDWLKNGGNAALNGDNTLMTVPFPNVSDKNGIRVVLSCVKSMLESNNMFLHESAFVLMVKYFSPGILSNLSCKLDTEESLLEPCSGKNFEFRQQSNKHSNVLISNFSNTSNKTSSIMDSKYNLIKSFYVDLLNMIFTWIDRNSKDFNEERLKFFGKMNDLYVLRFLKELYGIDSEYFKYCVWSFVSNHIKFRKTVDLNGAFELLVFLKVSNILVKDFYDIVFKWIDICIESVTIDMKSILEIGFELNQDERKVLDVIFPGTNLNIPDLEMYFVEGLKNEVTSIVKPFSQILLRLEFLIISGKLNPSFYFLKDISDVLVSGKLSTANFHNQFLKLLCLINVYSSLDISKFKDLLKTKVQYCHEIMQDFYKTVTNNQEKGNNVVTNGHKSLIEMTKLIFYLSSRENGSSRNFIEIVGTDFDAIRNHQKRIIDQEDAFISDEIQSILITLLGNNVNFIETKTRCFDVREIIVKYLYTMLKCNSSCVKNLSEKARQEIFKSVLSMFNFNNDSLGYMELTILILLLKFDISSKTGSFSENISGSWFFSYVKSFCRLDERGSQKFLKKIDVIFNLFESLTAEFIEESEDDIFLLGPFVIVVISSVLDCNTELVKTKCISLLKNLDNQRLRWMFSKIWFGWFQKEDDMFRKNCLMSNIASFSELFPAFLIVDLDFLTKIMEENIFNRKSMRQPLDKVIMQKLNALNDNLTMITIRLFFQLLKSTEVASSIAVIRFQFMIAEVLGIEATYIVKEQKGLNYPSEVVQVSNEVSVDEDSSNLENLPSPNLNVVDNLSEDDSSRYEIVLGHSGFDMDNDSHRRYLKCILFQITKLLDKYFVNFNNIDSKLNDSIEMERTVYKSGKLLFFFDLIIRAASDKLLNLDDVTLRLWLDFLLVFLFKFDLDEKFVFDRAQVALETLINVILDCLSKDDMSFFKESAKHSILNESTISMTLILFIIVLKRSVALSTKILNKELQVVCLLLDKCIQFPESVISLRCKYFLRTVFKETYAESGIFVLIMKSKPVKIAATSKNEEDSPKSTTAMVDHTKGEGSSNNLFGLFLNVIHIFSGHDRKAHNPPDAADKMLLELPIIDVCDRLFYYKDISQRELSNIFNNMKLYIEVVKPRIQDFYKISAFFNKIPIFSFSWPLHSFDFSSIISLCASMLRIYFKKYPLLNVSIKKLLSFGLQNCYVSKESLNELISSITMVYSKLKDNYQLAFHSIQNDLIMKEFLKDLGYCIRNSVMKPGKLSNLVDMLNILVETRLSNNSIFTNDAIFAIEKDAVFVLAFIIDKPVSTLEVKEFLVLSRVVAVLMRFNSDVYKILFSPEQVFDKKLLIAVYNSLLLGLGLYPSINPLVQIIFNRNKLIFIAEILSEFASPLTIDSAMISNVIETAKNIVMNELKIKNAAKASNTAGLRKIGSLDLFSPARNNVLVSLTSPPNGYNAKSFIAFPIVELINRLLTCLKTFCIVRCIQAQMPPVADIYVDKACEELLWSKIWPIFEKRLLYEIKSEDLRDTGGEMLLWETLLDLFIYQLRCHSLIPKLYSGVFIGLYERYSNEISLKNAALVKKINTYYILLDSYALNCLSVEQLQQELKNFSFIIKSNEA